MALGQSGFVFKGTTGLVVAVDPCLADPVAEVIPGWSRLYPPPVEPSDLRCDILLVTHDHLDHLDPDTISGLTRDAVRHFVGPRNACRHFAKLGIPQERIVQVDASETLELESMRITGTLAITNDSKNPDAEGFVLRLPDAPVVYHTGDTSFHPLLADVADEKLDVYMPCINGRYHNMDSLEAAVLGAVLRCRWAIPHHYDMFRDNLADPAEFEAQMSRLFPETACLPLKPGEIALLGGDE